MIAATTLAYVGSLKYGFSQDDWYFLSISVARNLGDVLNFFNPWSQSGFAFYRPLGTQLYYYLSRLFLGLGGAPLGMHLFMLFIQSVSAYNVYRLIHKLTKDHLLSVLAGLIYATSSVHFLSLYYIAATQQLLAALFALLSINDYLDHRHIRSSLYFALALLSKEVAIVTPLIMILAEQKIHSEFQLTKLVKSLIPVAVVGLLYVGIRVFGGLHVQSEYQFVLGGTVISTMRWYYLFGFGTPEELVRYGLPKMVIDFSRYIHDYGYLGIITSFVPLSLSIGVLSRSIMSIFNRGGICRRDLGIYFTWWILALSPILFLQDHRYPHYVDLALIPMILLSLEHHRHKIQVIIASLMIIVSLFSINLSESTHWTVKRAVDARALYLRILAIGDCSAQGGVVFEGSKKELLEIGYAMSLTNGPRVICQNPALQVYYKELP